MTFAVAAVKTSAVNSPASRDQAIQEFSTVFDGLPTVLMTQDSRGIPTYFGRRDLVNFLASVPMEAIPWRTYTLASAA